MKGRFGNMLWLLILIFTSSILSASARNTFVPGEESLEKPRMLRGVSLNDYDDVSANPGHDPGNNGGRGGNGGWRRENP